MRSTDKTRVRRFTPKTRTGCLTCKRRRVKCDERKPTCAACEKVKTKCEGYAVLKTWLFEPSNSKDGSHSGGSASPSTSDLGQGGGDGGGMLVQSANRKNSDTGEPLYVLEPILFPSLFNNTGEPAVIMDAYLDLSSDTPMAWDTSLYRTRSLKSGPVVDHNGALKLHNQPLDPTPLRHQSHLALATSMLALALPHRFPHSLYLKYMSSTVSEIRKQINHSTFSMQDLISGISQTLLACVLQGDTDSIIAHLRAAFGLVKSLGGIDKIDPNIAAVLRYSDFHFALESLLAPVFPLVVDLRAQYEGSLSALTNNTLMPLAEETMSHAKSLPPVIELVIRRFANAVLALAQAVASTADAALSYQELNWMASHAAGSLHILLGVYPSALATEVPFRQQTPIYESYTILLILWLQLLMCTANETLSAVSIRLSCLTVRNHEFREEQRCTYASERIDEGLMRWNQAVREAKLARESPPGDWEAKMVSIVEEMELDLPVRLGPLMRGLLESTAEIRHLSRVGRPVFVSAMEENDDVRVVSGYEERLNESDNEDRAGIENEEVRVRTVMGGGVTAGQIVEDEEELPMPGMGCGGQNGW
ncbi:uncharacterized protein AB675_9924 [Cyphellophora attinorum]|uniref:Zn(2)-C6 fungal-type domain-containing protein n=1 Tax=Cyphellophora attinorum TaxID=1664694 RepID=A0A0N0NI27_9EURO|nr:uncharacterized protein AB675_9924 [Phialophora attinorum]KPI35361.1 hypothetical protein AB675_9924 [Phialophora attinorum]